MPIGLRRLNVYRHDHPDYSDYRFARRFQRHRRRTVLRHRLLWRRGTRVDHRYSADTDFAGTDIVASLVIPAARKREPTIFRQNFEIPGLRFAQPGMTSRGRTAQTKTRDCHPPRKARDPGLQAAHVQTDKTRRTGYTAFAGYDSSANMRCDRYSAPSFFIAALIDDAASS